jgi:CDP-diacylglycerol--serine O-phosphatidyltransferase
LAWIGGAFDIFDGKIARKYGLSNEFGIQLDSFADFLSFVLVPVFLIFEAVYVDADLGSVLLVAGAISIYYVISGLRRLIYFNINADAGEVENYFTGVPTPLGAILLWLVYLGYIYSFIPTFAVMGLMILIGWSLNSNIKVKHL